MPPLHFQRFPPLFLQTPAVLAACCVCFSIDPGLKLLPYLAFVIFLRTFVTKLIYYSQESNFAYEVDFKGEIYDRFEIYIREIFSECYWNGSQ